MRSTECHLDFFYSYASFVVNIIGRESRNDFELVMLVLGLGLKTKICGLGLGLEAKYLALALEGWPCHKSSRPLI